MRHLTSVLSAALLAGCVTATPVARTQVVVDPVPPPPLTARLYEAGGGGFTFDVSDDAFVAIFEIVPNVGASIVYPSRPGEYNFVSGGHLRIAPTIIRPVGRWMYQGGFRSYWEPTYYYMVASRRPLALGPLLTRIGGVREAIGWRHFVAGSPYATMDLLARAVLPTSGLDEEDWTDDLLVSFPPPPVYYASRSAWVSRLPVVHCADGRRHLAYDLPVGCFERETPVEPPQRKPPRDSVAPPTSDPKVRPVPKAPRKEIDAKRPELKPRDGLRQPRATDNTSNAKGRLSRASIDDHSAGRRTGRVALDGKTWSAGGPEIRRPRALDEGVRGAERAGRGSSETGSSRRFGGTRGGEGVPPMTGTHDGSGSGGTASRGRTGGGGGGSVGGGGGGGTKGANGGRKPPQ